MKKYLPGMLSVCAIAALTGCTTNIAKLPITARDQQTYENKYAKDYENNDENSQALRVAIVPQNPSIQGNDKRTLGNLKSLTNSFGDGLETAFSNLADFEVAPRSELGSIVADQALTEISTGKASNFKVKNVNYMVVYRVSSYNFQKASQLFAKKNAKPSFRAYVKVKVSLINLQDNVKEFTKTIVGESAGSSSAQNIGLLNQAIESAVRDFSTQFAVDYAPPAIVQQTKGSGQVAMLNVGKDYGLMKNMKVEFFFFKEKKGKRRVIPFAYGKILEVAEDSAWVEVDDFETAGVKENHFARVRKDQSKSFLEKMPLQ
ncbi:MAG: hypothetical protein L3J71_10790 [Victivallaceae bacterium]|nr:hypothetical protein [Victivallaceae bacterium]